MILRQTFKNHFIPLEFTLTVNLLFLAIWWFFIGDIEAFIFTEVLLNLVFTVPALYLHLEYTIRNRGEEIEIMNSELIVRRNGQELKYNADELENIIVYKSASLDKWGMPFSAMEYYFYVRIILKKGEEIIITCLMGRKVDEIVRKNFNTVPYKRVKGFFCTLRMK